MREAYERCAAHAPLAQPPVQPEAPAVEPPTPGPSEPFPQEQAAWLRYEAVHRELNETPLEERTGKLREHLEEHPDDDEARAWLADELLARGETGEAAALLREGAARGEPSYLVDLAERLPDELTDDELDQVAGDAPYRAFEVLMRRGRVDDAAELVAREVRRFAEAPYPYVSTHLDCLLRLALADRIHPVRALFTELRAAIDGAGLGTQLSVYDAAQLALVGDLLATWEALPSELATILTSALRAGALEEAESEVRAFAYEQRRAAKQAGRALVRHGPTLARIVNAWLYRHSDPRGPVLVFVIVGIVVSSVLRTCAGGRCDAIREATRPRSRAPDVAQVCEADRPLCDDAERLSHAIRDGDCAQGITPALLLDERLRRARGAGSPSPAAARAQRLLDRYQMNCRGSPP